MKFTIATFNVENLIGPEKPIYDQQRPRYSADEYHKKINWIKNQLLTMNADIVGFQEIFEEQALRDCIAGTIYKNWHLCFARRQSGKPGNALLSKFPIASSQSIEEIPFIFNFFDSKQTETETSTLIPIPIKQFSRAVLKAVIQIREDIAIIVYVVHLKSKRPILANGVTRDSTNYSELAQGEVRSLVRRAIESAGIRTLLSQDITHTPTHPIIFLGDLNDADTAVTNQIILGEPPFYKLPQKQKVERWKYTLQDSANIQARKSLENFHFTYIHDGHHESLDNIFVSNHFSDLNRAAIGRVIDIRVYNDHLVDHTLGHQKKIWYITDHGQVVMNVQLF